MISNTLIYSLFLVPLLVIGILSSYSDIKYGKIKNIYIILGIGWVIFLYSFIFLYTYFGLHQLSNINYIKKSLLNGLLAFIVGYFLWYINLWAAGDAKLFTIYAFLLPLEFYSKSYFPYFPSFVLLFDTFILILLFLLAKICVRGIFLAIKKNKNFFSRTRCNSSIIKKESLLKKINYKNLLHGLFTQGKLFFTYFLIFVFLQLIRSKVNVLLQKFISNLALVYLLLFTVQIFAFRKILKSKVISLIVTIVGLFSVLYFIISGNSKSLLGILRLVIFFMVIIGLSMKLLNLYIDKNEIRKIKIKDIKPGLFPVPRDLLRIEKIIKENKLNIKMSNISSDGLSVEQTELIKNLFKDKPEAEITIYKTFHFAPFLMAAALISITTKSSFIPLVSTIFQTINR